MSQPTLKVLRNQGNSITRIHLWEQRGEETGCDLPETILQPRGVRVARGLCAVGCLINFEQLTCDAVEVAGMAVRGSR